MKQILKPINTWEYEIEETRKYTVQGAGRSAFEAKQDAMERFHRLTKSHEIYCHTVSKPRVIKETKRR